jgi:emfourin
MKISLVRSGGFAGMRQQVHVDTSALDPNSAQQFRKLVDAADLPLLSEPTIRVKSEPDRFCYTLTVDDGVQQHSITFEEHRIPDSVRPLIEAVWEGGGPDPGTQTA